MKKYCLVLLIVVAAISCNVHRNDQVVDDAVKEKADAAKQIAAAMLETTTVQLIDSVYNFGTITEGEKVIFNFRFKNTGAKPLVIANATASCGCTIPEKPEKPIAPGEIGFIKVVFNSAGKRNHNEKHITVNANTDPAFPQLILTGDVTAAK